MAQSQFPVTSDISCENITKEVIASYAKQGFVLAFAEEVMRYDLSQTLPQITPPSLISYLTWNAQTIPAFFATYQAAFRERPGFPGWSENAWVHWVADDPTFRPEKSFLALVEGQPVGFVTNAEDEEAPERNGYLIQVGVDPRWRGQRVGAALTVRSLQAWQEAGKEAVILHVNTNNPTAIRLYQQLGFVVLRRRGKFRLQTGSTAP